MDLYGNDVNGFYASLYRNSKTGHHVFATRGTDDKVSDVASDAQIFAGYVPAQFFDAKAALNKACRSIPGLKKKLYLTGHSLGGGLSVLLAFVTKRPLPVVTFNAPGMAKVMKEFKYRMNSDSVNALDTSRVLHIAERRDAVSSMNDYVFENKVGNNFHKWDTESCGQGPVNSRASRAGNSPAKGFTRRTCRKLVYRRPRKCFAAMVWRIC